MPKSATTIPNKNVRVPIADVHPLPTNERENENETEQANAAIAHLQTAQEAALSNQSRAFAENQRRVDAAARGEDVPGGPADTSFHIPGYKTGTNYVPKTGVYQLHEGEAVVPKEDNPHGPLDLISKKNSKNSKKSKSEKPPVKSIREIRIRKAHNNQFIVEHHHWGAFPREEFVIDALNNLRKHLSKHAGESKAGERSKQ